MIYIPIEFVKATLGYREVKPIKETATHMLYTVKEHNDKNNKITELEHSIIDLQNQYKRELNTTVKDANEHLENTREDAEIKIKEVKSEYNKAIDKIKHLKNINTNLIRVAKERANAQRKLQPKKQHCGYILQLIEPVVFIHKDTHTRRIEITNFSCWRFRLQTPYNISFDLEAVTDLVHKDYIDTLADIIGVQEGYINGGLENAKIEGVIKVFERTDNFYFKKTFRINATRGFWEVEYWTKDIISYSDEILNNKNNIKVCGDGKKNTD